MTKKGRPFLIPSITMVPSLIGPFHHPLPTHSRQLQKGRELRKLPRKMRSNCRPNKGTTFYLKPTEVTFTINDSSFGNVCHGSRPPLTHQPFLSQQQALNQLTEYCVMCSSLGKPCPMFTPPALTFSLQHSNWSDVEEDWDDEKQKEKERKEKEEKEN